MPTAFKMPAWKEVERYFKDPEIVTTETLFLFLTLSNVFVMYKLFSDVIPYPIFVTWWQLSQGLCMAAILGMLGKEYPKIAYFPQVEVSFNLLKKLFFQSLVYIGMLVCANIILSKITVVGTFPVVVSFTVVLHHVTRFVGCGEDYMALRWYSILLIFLAFVIGCTDENTISMSVLPYTLLCACCSAAFRGCYLQKIMHIVEGRGNILHNHQHAIAIVVLPALWIATGEWKVIYRMPYDFWEVRTWQMWGCLITVGALPFVKNIVSNRLIRRTGQAPWRVLEIVSIFSVFVIGFSLSSSFPGWKALVCTSILMLGRIIGMCDVIINAEDAKFDASSGGAGTRGGNFRMNGRGAQRSGEIDEMNSGMDTGSQKPFLQAIEEDDDGTPSYYDREGSMPA